jgi:hypothetical protein
MFNGYCQYKVITAGTESKQKTVTMQILLNHEKHEKHEKNVRRAFL